MKLFLAAASLLVVSPKTLAFTPKYIQSSSPTTLQTPRSPSALAYVENTNFQDGLDGMRTVVPAVKKEQDPVPVVVEKEVDPVVVKQIDPVIYSLMATLQITQETLKSEYLQWAVQYAKTPTDKRYVIFTKNLLLQEQWNRQHSKRFTLNEHGDRTEGEFKHMRADALAPPAIPEPPPLVEKPPPKAKAAQDQKTVAVVEEKTSQSADAAAIASIDDVESTSVAKEKDVEEEPDEAAAQPVDAAAVASVDSVEQPPVVEEQVAKDEPKQTTAQPADATTIASIENIEQPSSSGGPRGRPFTVLDKRNGSTSGNKSASNKQVKAEATASFVIEPRPVVEEEEIAQEPNAAAQAMKEESIKAIKLQKPTVPDHSHLIKRLDVNTYMDAFANSSSESRPIVKEENKVVQKPKGAKLEEEEVREDIKLEKPTAPDHSHLIKKLDGNAYMDAFANPDMALNSEGTVPSIVDPMPASTEEPSILASEGKADGPNCDSVVDEVPPEGPPARSYTFMRSDGPSGRAYTFLSNDGPSGKAYTFSGSNEASKEVEANDNFPSNGATKQVEANEVDSVVSEASKQVESSADFPSDGITKQVEANDVASVVSEASKQVETIDNFPSDYSVVSEVAAVERIELSPPVVVEPITKEAKATRIFVDAIKAGFIEQSLPIFAQAAGIINNAVEAGLIELSLPVFKAEAVVKTPKAVGILELFAVAEDQIVVKHKADQANYALAKVDAIAAGLIKHTPIVVKEITTTSKTTGLIELLTIAAEEAMLQHKATQLKADAIAAGLIRALPVEEIAQNAKIAAPGLLELLVIAEEEAMLQHKATQLKADAIAVGLIRALPVEEIAQDVKAIIPGLLELLAIAEEEAVLQHKATQLKADAIAAGLIKALPVEEIAQDVKAIIPGLLELLAIAEKETMLQNKATEAKAHAVTAGLIKHLPIVGEEIFKDVNAVATGLIELHAVAEEQTMTQDKASQTIEEDIGVTEESSVVLVDDTNTEVIEETDSPTVSIAMQQQLDAIKQIVDTSGNPGTASSSAMKQKFDDIKEILVEMRKVDSYRRINEENTRSP